MTFTDLLTHYGIPFKSEGHEHCRPGWIQMDCPDCGQHEHWRLGYNIHYGYAHCWTCGGKWIVDVLQKLTNKSHRDIQRDLKEIAYEGHLDTGAYQFTKRGTYKEPPGNESILADVHKKYLHGRGFDPIETQIVWGVQGIRTATRLAWRLFIPITNAGIRVSWTTRAITDTTKRRYINARAEEEAQSAKEILYGADKARHGITIHEGPLDAWAIGIGGTAVMGLNVSPAQIEMMVRFPLRIIWFDNNPEAQRRASWLWDQLECFEGKTMNFRSDEKDAAETLLKKPRVLHRIRKMLT